MCSAELPIVTSDSSDLLAKRQMTQGCEGEINVVTPKDSRHLKLKT
jgi:hypothetical protein